MERGKREEAEGTTMEVTEEDTGAGVMVMTIMVEAMAMMMGTVVVTGTMMVMEREEGRGLVQAAL